MKFSFTKYSGCGNDFVVIDDRALCFPTENGDAIQQICRRRIGVGADGVILLQNSLSADFRMRIFNADGNEAEMCGNGIRCLMKFIRQLGVQRTQLDIATGAGTLRVEHLEDGCVAVAMGAPKGMQWGLQFTVDSSNYNIHYMTMGVPHAIHFTENLESIDLPKIGKKFRNLPFFSPCGTNFNAVAIESTGELRNRTYERGVEGETLACGTGCTAVALAAHKIYGLPSPITVHTKSKEQLKISFDFVGEQFSNVAMIGPANRVFDGEVAICR